MKILALIAPLFEEMELLYPVYRLREAKHTVHIVGEKTKTAYKGKNGYLVTSDLSFDEVKSTDYAGVVIPGGFAPDKLRRIPAVLSCVKEMDEAQKPIGFICHGGWVPISAKILKGKRATGTTAIKDDLENAGAIWEDTPIVIDGHLISSRTPHDLPDFGRALVEAFS